jgi:thiol-disulfide isomerase/thioredoxin
MRIILLTLIATFLSIGTFSQDNVKLTGVITNPTGDKVYLYKPTLVDKRMKPEYHDSTTLAEDGKFELSASVSETEGAVFFDGNEQFSMLLSPDDQMHLKLNTAYFDETLQFSGQGSEKNNALVAISLVHEINAAKLEPLLKDSDIDTTTLFNLVDKNNEAYLALIKDYENEIPDIKLMTSDLIESEERNIPYLKNYVRSKVEFKKKMKPLLNNPAIDFKGLDLKGNTVSLSDFKGKVTVVDFWAPWCGPCKAEFPAYKELEEKYGNNVNFVSVGVYCKEENWKKMAEDEEFNNNIFVSKKEIDQISAYEVKTIPRYLVIDENFNLIDADAPRPSSGELESYWK